jgi:L-lactate dehydrogenase (cytochrome)
MSSFAGYACETVAARATAPLWYQLYLAGGREVTEATLARVWQAGFQVLAVTIDTNAPGNRERDLHNGVPALMSGHYFRMLRYLPAGLRRPRWTAQFLADRDALFFPNIQLPGQGACPAADVRAMLTGAVVTWADFTWIRQAWPGPILAKGVLTADDTRRAFDTGCAGVIVSNHGGRQLDTCAPTAHALPEVVRAANGQGPVLVDGGAGAARAIAMLKADLERTMALLGCGAIRELDGSLVDVPKASSPLVGAVMKRGCAPRSAHGSGGPMHRRTSGSDRMECTIHVFSREVTHGDTVSNATICAACQPS